MAIIILWFINALALIFVCYLLAGVHVAGLVLHSLQRSF